MPWSKLDDEFYDHPKVVEAGTLGAGMFTVCLSYVGRKLTDGFIATSMIRRLCADLDDPIALADRLVDVGLFERAEGGYQIHDYLEYNPPAAKILAERYAAKERMRAARAANGQFGEQERSGDVPAQFTGTLADVQSAPSPSPSPSPIPDPSPSPAAAAAAHTSGVGKVLADHGILVNGPVQADMWRDLYDEAGTDLFTQALDEAARASPRVPTLKYIDAIIKRCMSDGTVPGDRRNRYSARASPMNDVDAAIEQYLREDGVTNGNGGDG
jgi:hypothetical protein